MNQNSPFPRRADRDALLEACKAALETLKAHKADRSESGKMCAAAIAQTERP